MKIFTKEDLLQNDGQFGRPAYVAINGFVYDVTNNNHWQNGNHHGLQAGKDLTKEINKSPHGIAILNNIDKIGILK